MRIPADVKNSEKYQSYANRIFTECKEYQNIHVFAFLQHLQAYLDILQIFLSAFPADSLKFPMVFPCECMLRMIQNYELPKGMLTGMSEKEYL